MEPLGEAGEEVRAAAEAVNGEHGNARARILDVNPGRHAVTGCFETGEHFAIERRLLAPRRAGHQPPVAHDVALHELSADRLDFEAHVLVAGEPLVPGQAGGREQLDAVTDREDPLLARVELPDDVEELPVVAQVLRRPSADAGRSRRSRRA